MYIDRNVICFCSTCREGSRFVLYLPFGSGRGRPMGARAGRAGRATGPQGQMATGPQGQMARWPQGQMANRAHEMEPSWSTGHGHGADGRRDVRDRSTHSAKHQTSRNLSAEQTHRHGTQDFASPSSRSPRPSICFYSMPPRRCENLVAGLGSSVWVFRFLQRSVPLDAGSSTCLIRMAASDVRDTFAYDHDTQRTPGTHDVGSPVTATEAIHCP